MSVIDVVGLATGREIALTTVTMVTEDLVEDQGHQKEEDQGAGQNHVTGRDLEAVVVAVTAGGVGAVIVGVAAEVTGVDLVADHGQEAGQEHLKTNKNRLMVKKSQSLEVLHQLALKKIQNRVLSVFSHNLTRLRTAVQRVKKLSSLYLRKCHSIYSICFPVHDGVIPFFAL